MKVPFRIYEGEFLPEMCRSIIRHAEEETSTSATIGEDNRADSGRIAAISFLHKENPIWHDLITTVDHLVQSDNEEFYGFDVNPLEYIEYLTYDWSVGGRYDAHQDINWDHPLKHRKVSFSIQLSNPEDYEGGNLELWSLLTNEKFTMPRELGTLITFPSATMHRVSPVIRGTRRSLVGWLSGDHWK